MVATLVSEAFIAERDRLLRYRKAKDFVLYLEKRRSRLTNTEDLEDIERRLRIKRENVEKVKRETLDRIYLLDNVICCEILELFFI